MNDSGTSENQKPLYVFEYSDEFVKSKSNTVGILKFFLVEYYLFFLTFALALGFNNFDLLRTLFIFALPSPLVLIIMYFFYLARPAILKKIMEIKVEIYADHIGIRSGEGVCAIPWQNITKITTSEDPSGKINSIIIEQVENTVSYILYLENMEGLYRILLEKSPDNIETAVRKDNWFQTYYSETFSIALSFLLALPLIGIVNILRGYHIEYILICLPFFLLPVAVFFIDYKYDTRKINMPWKKRRLMFIERR